MVLAVLFFSASAYAEDVMKFSFSEMFPPYSWEADGKVQGILIDITDEAIHKRMGISVSHSLYPWKRAQHQVMQGVLDAHITNGIVREEWAEHSDEVVMKLEWGIYVKAGNPELEQIKKAKSLEELKNFLFVDHLGNGWAKSNLTDKGFHVFMAYDQEAIYKMLVKGRGDININTAHVARYHIKNLGLQDQIVELPPVTPGNPFHLVIGKKSPFTKILPEFDKVIQQMKDDGSLQAIIDKYTK
jgi:polar amino acid transport system substrate-binding protein